MTPENQGSSGAPPADANTPALLPCPFCGSDAAVIEGDNRYYVTCLGLLCPCCMGEVYDAYATPNHVFASHSAAVDCWNKRAMPSLEQEGTDEHAAPRDNSKDSSLEPSAPNTEDGAGSLQKLQNEFRKVREQFAELECSSTGGEEKAVRWKCERCKWQGLYSRPLEREHAELAHRRANARSLHNCCGTIEPFGDRENVMSPIAPERDTGIEKVCANCGKPATCCGVYESAKEATYACDDCCGHGNEDGWCDPVDDARPAGEQGADRANTVPAPKMAVLKKPVAPGFHWHRFDPDLPWVVRYVHYSGGCGPEWYECHELMQSDKANDWKGEWVGPLKEPSDPSGNVSSSASGVSSKHDRDCECDDCVFPPLSAPSSAGQEEGEWETQFDETSSLYYICRVSDGQPVIDYGFSKKSEAEGFSAAHNAPLREKEEQKRKVIGGIVIPRNENDDTTAECEWRKWWERNGFGIGLRENPMRQAFLAAFQIASRLAAESESAGPNTREGQMAPLLRRAVCPDCDGSGIIPVGSHEDGWEPSQCQWCYEREMCLSSSAPNSSSAQGVSAEGETREWKYPDDPKDATGFYD